MRHVSLGIILFLFWLALSGHYHDPFLLGIGLASAALCVYVAHRMNGVDSEGFPIHLLLRAFSYWPWLIWEIAKSAWSVTKIIINPALPISPTMTVVKASQSTPVGISVYANSITLTPGTITTGVTGNDLTVHALVVDGADDLEGGNMDSHVTRFEGVT